MTSKTYNNIYSPVIRATSYFQYISKDTNRATRKNLLAVGRKWGGDGENVVPGASKSNVNV